MFLVILFNQVPLPEDTKLFDNLNIAREKDGAATTTDCVALQQRFSALSIRLGLLETSVNPLFQTPTLNSSSADVLLDFSPESAPGNELELVEVPARRGLKCVLGEEMEDCTSGERGHSRRLRENPTSKPVSMHLNDGELLYQTNPDDLGLHHRFDAKRAGLSEEGLAYEGGKVNKATVKPVRHSPAKSLEYAIAIHADWEMDAVGKGAKRGLLSNSDATKGPDRWESSEDDVIIPEALSKWSHDPGTLTLAGTVLPLETVESGPEAVEDGSETVEAALESAVGSEEGPGWFADIIPYQRRTLLQAPATSAAPELTPVEFTYLQQWSNGFLSARVNYPGGHAE